VVNENEKMQCDGGDLIEVESAIYGTPGTYGLGKHICQVKSKFKKLNLKTSKFWLKIELLVTKMKF